MELSIIIPVFNMESTLKRTLKDLISQIANTDDIEIIVLDDNSTDNTRNIIREFPDIRMIVHSTRVSTGALRNEGIALATKKYLVFLDGDDTICLDTVRKLVSMMGDDTQIGIASYNNIELQSGKILDHKPGLYYNNKATLWQDTRALYPVLFSAVNAACWNKVFNRDFIADNDIQFSDGFYAEDMCFMRIALLLSKRVCYTADTMINYSTPESNPNSTDVKSVINETWRDLFVTLNTVLSRLVEFRPNIHNREYIQLLNSFSTDSLGHIAYQSKKFFKPVAEFNEEAIAFIQRLDDANSEARNSCLWQ